jgi:hypothetical protein
MRYQVTALSADTFGIRDTHPCGDNRTPLWRVDSRAAWLSGSWTVAYAYVSLLNAEEIRYNAVPHGKCHTPGCARDASYDSEPGAGGYFSDCERCSNYVGHRGHVHAHGYWPEYIAAHPGTRTDAYMRTSEIMRPLVKDDAVIGYRCGDYMCGYTLTQERYECRTYRWFGGVHTWGVFDHVTGAYVSFGEGAFTSESQGSIQFMADTLNG